MVGTDLVGTDLVVAFVPTIVLSRVDEELHTLVPIALIWPPDMADQLEPRGDVLNLFGQRDTYVVTDDFVDIKIQLPFHIQNQRDRLAVEIWPNHDAYRSRYDLVGCRMRQTRKMTGDFFRFRVKAGIKPFAPASSPCHRHPRAAGAPTRLPEKVRTAMVA